MDMGFTFWGGNENILELEVMGYNSLKGLNATEMHTLK